jgi:Flp pilus assembly protein TadD
MFVDAGRLVSAISLARRAVGRFPSQAEPCEWATQLLMEDGRFEEAYVEAREWRRRSLADPIAVESVIASILSSLNRHADAARQLDPFGARLVRERETAPQRLALWLRELVLAGRFDEAAAQVGPLLEGSEQWRHLWLGMIGLASDQQMYDSLLHIEHLCMEDAGESLRLAAAWNLLGRRSGREDCLDRAEAIAQRAADDEQHAATALLVLGGIAESRGELEEAESLYRRAVSMKPEDMVAVNNLAYVLAGTADGAAEALALAEKALAADPQQPDFLDTYAAVLIALGRLEEAEAALRSAHSLRPEDVAIGLNLAELLARVQKDEEARELATMMSARLRAMPWSNAGQRQRLDALLKQLESAASTSAQAQ